MRIAISGLSGCGNTTVTKIVAERLGIKQINYTMHDMAREAEIPFEEFHRQAEEKFPEVDLQLESKQLQMVLDAGDCVIGSRLAAWLDDERVLDALGAAPEQRFNFDYKFWLEAPVEVRAARIAKREGRGLQETIESVKARDAADSSRYERAYGVNLQAHLFATVIDAGEPAAEEVAAEIAGCVS
jgi:cytidylate kinase